MKKFIGVFVLLFVGALGLFAADGGGIIEGPIWETVASIVGGIIVLAGVGTWLFKKGAHLAAAKVENVLEKAALGLDGAASVARSAGLDKLTTCTEEFADVPDELGDVAGKFAEMTKNQDFTKERFLELINEGREVAVEAKGFVMAIKKKEEEITE